MYKVFFDIHYGAGNPQPRQHPADSTDDLDEAIKTAKLCYGYVMKGNTIIADYRVH